MTSIHPFLIFDSRTHLSTKLQYSIAPSSFRKIMWNLRHLSRQRRNLTAAAAVGTSAIAIVELWCHDANNTNDSNILRRQETTERNPNENKSSNIINNKWGMDDSLIISKNLIMPRAQNHCQCEAASAFQASPTQKKADIQRRATIRLLNATSTPIRNLHATYKVNWNQHLGEGAFGSVYLAVNRRTGEKLALKKIPKKFTDSASFQNEMNALLQVRRNGGHPNICSLRENFEDDKYYYVLLDLVSGTYVLSIEY